MQYCVPMRYANDSIRCTKCACVLISRWKRSEAQRSCHPRVGCVCLRCPPAAREARRSAAERSEVVKAAQRSAAAGGHVNADYPHESCARRANTGAAAAPRTRTSLSRIAVRVPLQTVIRCAAQCSAVAVCACVCTCLCPAAAADTSCARTSAGA